MVGFHGDGDFREFSIMSTSAVMKHVTDVTARNIQKHSEKNS